MKVLEVLTYYHPHVSGLTIYVKRLSRALVQKGHEVTVLTSQFDDSLPLEETIDGVKIVRVPVAFRVSKGVIMPSFGFKATKYVRSHDVVHLHLPQFDAPGVAMRGKLFNKPVVLTYHCDLRLPNGLFNRVVDKVTLGANRTAGALADAVVTYTRDYGSNSPYLSKYLGDKLYIIPPPVELDVCSDEKSADFHTTNALAGRKVIGICTRLATEKGVEVLLKALPRLLEKHPNALVIHAGTYKNVMGEEAYWERLQPLLKKHANEYKFLGTLHGADLTAFYKNLDALVVCSLNRTESFGLVQIEAMKHGVPVCASNLPGVRQPVTMTGMGQVSEIGDHEALADALIAVLDDKEKFIRSADTIGNAFDPSETADEYLKLFNNLKNGVKDSSAAEPPAYDGLRDMNEKALETLNE